MLLATSATSTSSDLTLVTARPVVRTFIRFTMELEDAAKEIPTSSSALLKDDEEEEEDPNMSEIHGL